MNPPRGHRREQLILTVILLFSMILAWFYGQQVEKRQRLEEEDLQRQMQALVQAELYAEAIKSYERNQKARTPQSSQLYFESLLERGEPKKAYEVWLKEKALQQDDQALQALLTVALDSPKPGLAMTIYQEQAKGMEVGERQDLLRLLFAKQQVRPVKGQLVFGWVRDYACLQDAEGLYLVNAEGKAIDLNRYDQVKPVKEGFLALRQGSCLLLDPAGRFKKDQKVEAFDQTEALPTALFGREGSSPSNPGGDAAGAEGSGKVKSPTEVEGLAAKTEDKEASQAPGGKGQSPAEGAFPEPLESDQGWTYGLAGQPLMKGAYDQVTPLSSRGIGYGLRGDQWEEILFPALKR